MRCLPRAAAVVILFLAVAISGCADNDGVSSDVDATPTSSRDFGASDEAGVQDAGDVQGRVVNDEQLPVPDARVIVIEEEASVRTGDDGVFEFLNLPPGEYSLAVSKTGYQSVAKNFQLVPGQDVDLEIVLLPVPTKQPHYEVLSHVAMHHYEAGLATWTLNYYAGAFTNDTIGQSCEACMLFATTTEIPPDMLLEITGQHAVAPPWGTARETWYAYRTQAITAEGSMGYSVTEMPTYLRFGSKEIQNSTEFLFTFYCDTVWICVEERRDVFLTVFYGMTLPEGYTALPRE